MKKKENICHIDGLCQDVDRRSFLTIQDDEKSQGEGYARWMVSGLQLCVSDHGQVVRFEQST